MLALESVKRSPVVSHRPGAARARGAFRAPARGRSLACLASTGLGDAFYSWRGASGRRHVFSIFAAQEVEMIAGFSGAAIIGVARDGAARRVVCVVSSCDFAKISAAAAAAMGGVAEWHVLFAADEAVIEDLRGALTR